MISRWQAPLKLGELQGAITKLGGKAKGKKEELQRVLVALLKKKPEALLALSPPPAAAASPSPPPPLALPAPSPVQPPPPPQPQPPTQPQPSAGGALPLSMRRPRRG